MASAPLLCHRPGRGFAVKVLQFCGRYLTARREVIIESLMTWQEDDKLLQGVQNQTLSQIDTAHNECCSENLSSFPSCFVRKSLATFWNLRWIYCRSLLNFQWRMSRHISPRSKGGGCPATLPLVNQTCKPAALTLILLKLETWQWATSHSHYSLRNENH